MAKGVGSVGGAGGGSRDLGVEEGVGGVQGLEGGGWQTRRLRTRSRTVARAKKNIKKIGICTKTFQVKRFQPCPSNLISQNYGHFKTTARASFFRGWSGGRGGVVGWGAVWGRCGEEGGGGKGGVRAGEGGGVRGEGECQSWRGRGLDWRWCQSEVGWREAGHVKCFCQCH